MKKEFNIFDVSFSHDSYCVAGRESKFMKWERINMNKSNPTFYTHDYMTMNINQKENSYGFLIESRAIIPHTYQRVEPYINKFEKVFTHNSEFIKKYNNCYWIPGGGIWVGGAYGKGTIEIKNKSKLCSIVSSNKQMCDLHKFRLGIANKLKGSNVDIFGINQWKPIHESLDDYMFSIVIENFKDDLYFTEKILNCFATGTIPIYHGAKKINEKFNIDGIFTFDTEEELMVILNNLSEKQYLEKRGAIEENFEKCMEFISVEDYIYKNYF